MSLVPLTSFFPKGLSFAHHYFTICRFCKNITPANSEGLLCSGNYHNRYTVIKLVNTYKSHVFGSCSMHENTDICYVLIKTRYKVSPIATLMCGSPSLMQLGLIFAVVRDKSTVKTSFSNFVPHCSFITLL